MKKTIATVDAETDPFKFGRKPEPFCWGLYTGNKYWDFWGDDCTDQLITHLAAYPEPLLIYAHNGGKFDFFYLLEKGVLADPIKIINGRIVSCRIGIHELRDSFAILPVPLAAYQKEKIDYDLFEKENREDNRNEILHYLATDCEYLHELVTAFVDEFGAKLTIGGTAMSKIKEYHPFDHQNDSHDELFRPYYYGGRVECFSRGKVKGDFKSYDVNSMYPAVMKNREHPTGNKYVILYENDLPESFTRDGLLPDFANHPYFIEFAGESMGAVPVRTDTGLSFETTSGVFKTMSHELQVGLKYGIIRIDEIIAVHVPELTINFGLFVAEYMARKIDAKKKGDKTGELFSKLLLNSGYGKFGQNPANFYDWRIRYDGEELPDFDFWELYLDTPYCEIWRSPSPRPVYYDVATAASITSAARAVLLEGLLNAVNPQYCDTDSIICERLKNVPLDSYALGSWDCEARGNTLYLGGKKLYALYDGDLPIKYASKGARLTPGQISQIALGKEITWRNDAPAFKLTGQVDFITRKLKLR